MKNLTKFLPWLLSICLFLLLILRQSDTITVEIPSKQGTFERDSLIPIAEVDPGSKIIKDFVNKSDSLKVETFKEAIKERVYEETFKDSVQEIKVTATARGYIENIKIDYITAPIKKEIDISRKLNVFIGLETEIQDPFGAVEAKAFIVTKKVIFSYGYSINTKSHSLGAAIKLF